MSTSLYQFSADDIATGGNFAIVSAGGQRLLFEGLSADEVQWFDRLSRHKSTDAPERTELLQVLLEKKILAINGLATPTKGPRIPSRLVKSIAGPWAPLTTGRALTFLAASGCASALFGAMEILGAHEPRPAQGVGAAFGQLLLTAFVLAVSVLFHEIGHAAACIRVSGTVGAIRCSKRPRSFGVYTDISSAGRASNAAKSAVYAAGSAFQIAFSGIVALAGTVLIGVSHALLLASIVGIVIAIWCAIPRPGSDGHAFVLAAFGMDISPKLFAGANGPADLVAGWALWIFRAVALLGVVMGAFFLATPGAFTR